MIAESSGFDQRWWNVTSLVSKVLNVTRQLSDTELLVLMSEKISAAKLRSAKASSGYAYTVVIST